jgi:hypothetical protein
VVVLVIRRAAGKDQRNHGRDKARLRFLGPVKDYADLARLGRVSAARITQIMNLRNLAPAIQEQIVMLPATTSAPAEIKERGLRQRI